MALLDFNVASVEARQANLLMPAGLYPVAIKSSDTKASKSGTNYVEFVMVVGATSPFAGQQIYFNANLWHHSPDAVNMARQNVRAIAEACGLQLETIRETSQLHGIPMMVKVKVRPGEGDFQPRNEIVNYAFKPGNFVPPVEAEQPVQKVTAANVIGGVGQMPQLTEQPWGQQQPAPAQMPAPQGNGAPAGYPPVQQQQPQYQPQGSGMPPLNVPSGNVLPGQSAQVAPAQVQPGYTGQANHAQGFVPQGYQLPDQGQPQGVMQSQPQQPQQVQAHEGGAAWDNTPVGF